MVTDLIKSVADRMEFIRSSEDFYYAKAQEEWMAWKSTNISPDLLNNLLELASNYDSFCASTDSQVVAIRNQIFRMVAYCDSKAKDKNELNQYPDKRTIARSGIRQNLWIRLLLEYKKKGEASMTEGFGNFVKYMEDPYDNFPILKEEHKRLAFCFFVGKPYSPQMFTSEMKRVFRPFSLCKNPINETVCIMAMIYALEEEWNKQEIQGIFVHDNTGWQDNAVVDSAGRGICLWWHKLPKRKEIMASLRSIVDDQRTFDFYFVQNNQAVYKATIVDFSMREEYDSKYPDWAKQNPAWIKERFDDYEDNDGARKASVVFLASKFERLTHQIPIKNFVLFQNMNYLVRGGVAAYTNILTNTELKQQDMIDEYCQLIEKNKNLILTGAPGTGKTYLAKQIAKRLIGVESDEELISSGQYEFVQFHPSYDYTDFVEGLRPTAPDEHGNVGFELRDGIFKQFCQRAAKNCIDSEKSRGDISFERLFEQKYNSLIEAIQNEEVDRLPIKTPNKYAEIGDVSDNGNILFKTTTGLLSKNRVSFNRLRMLADRYKTLGELNDMANINQSIREVIGGCNSTWYWAVLHYIYSVYGDMSVNDMDEEPVTLKNYVFVIDEINRGEVSKIFGELFFSIEVGYRGKKGGVNTQYANMHETDEKFYVPQNVYIIGTMNDIDRSVESFDFAMRRRFIWREVTAEESARNMNLPQEVVDRMERLNAAISKIEGLNSSYHVGGAYFLSLQDNCNLGFVEIWNYRLEPLLKEYLRGMPNIQENLAQLKLAYEYGANNR